MVIRCYRFILNCADWWLQIQLQMITNINVPYEYYLNQNICFTVRTIFLGCRSKPGCPLTWKWCMEDGYYIFCYIENIFSAHTEFLRSLGNIFHHSKQSRTFMRDSLPAVWIHMHFSIAEYVADIRPLGSLLSCKMQKVSPIPTPGIRDTLLQGSGDPAKSVLTSLTGLSIMFIMIHYLQQRLSSFQWWIKS